MSHFHSRQSANDDEAEPTRERAYRVSTLVPLEHWDVETDFYTESLPILASEQSRQVPVRSSRRSTDALTSISVPLRAVPTTQPFVATLQSTMKPRTAKVPLVIHGSRTQERKIQHIQQLQLKQQLPHTGKLPRRAHRLHPSLRLGVVAMTTIGILLFTLFSLSPLGSSQSGFTLFNGAIRWAQGQQGWDGMVAGMRQKEQPAGANTTTTKNPPAVVALPRGAYVDIARQVAVRYGIDPNNFIRQIQQESHFDPNALSPSGAVGIAQFIPSTAASIGVNPYDPISALDGAARLMASLSSQFGGDYSKALAAYNAGPGAVQSAVNMGGAMWLAFLPPETQNYVRTIMG